VADEELNNGIAKRQSSEIKGQRDVSATAGGEPAGDGISDYPPAGDRVDGVLQGIRGAGVADLERLHGRIGRPGPESSRRQGDVRHFL
jgi:hypothetical protein